MLRHLSCALLLLVSSGDAKLKVITSTTDLKNIAEIIGGDRVTVTSIARSGQDPHFVEILPSYMLKVKRGDIYLKIGMELDVWSDPIINGARNRKLTVVDCSKQIEAREVPTDKIDASMGDIHRFGNPHYWLDPENGKIIASTIAQALATTDPEGNDYYATNLRNFLATIDESMTRWQDKFAALAGVKIVLYHNSWPYFTSRFGLQTVAFIEPKPGVSPSPAHLNRLINIIADDDIVAIASASYFSDKAPAFISEKTGVPVVKLAQSTGALPGTESWLMLFEYNLTQLKAALGDQ